MKIRNGFVSNSSSSSFIIIQKSDKMESLKSYVKNDIIELGDVIGGHSEFGWKFEKHFDILSKINFAFLQTTYINNPKYLKMLENVIKKESDAKIVIWNFSKNKFGGNNEFYDGYIDHSSSSIEGANMEIFDSEENLIDFLFSPYSYIRTCNDNDEYEDDN